MALCGAWQLAYVTARTVNIAYQQRGGAGVDQVATLAYAGAAAALSMAFMAPAALGASITSGIGGRRRAAASA